MKFRSKTTFTQIGHGLGMPNEEELAVATRVSSWRCPHAREARHFEISQSSSLLNRFSHCFILDAQFANKSV